LQLSIPSVVIVVEGASSSTRLTVDEAPAEPGQRIWLDPGEHSALAVDGERQVSRAFSLRRGERNAETALVLPVPPAAPVTPERKSVLPGVLLGLGGTSLLVGSTLGVWAVARRPDGRLRLPSVCQQRETTECPESEREAVSDELARAESARKAIRTEGTAGAVLLAGGLTLATTGIALAWARSHSARRGPALALHAKLLCAEVRIDF
jgi:hypothetical protein